MGQWHYITAKRLKYLNFKIWNIWVNRTVQSSAFECLILFTSSMIVESWPDSPKFGHWVDGKFFVFVLRFAFSIQKLGSKLRCINLPWQVERLADHKPMKIEMKSTRGQHHQAVKTKGWSPGQCYDNKTYLERKTCLCLKKSHLNVDAA